MISQRIDLTENRDFSGGIPTIQHSVILEDTTISRIEFERIRNLQNNMSHKEFSLLRHLEKMFGRREHVSEAVVIFQKYEKKLNKLKCSCMRCGKSIAPWYKAYICNTCNLEIEAKLPWENREEAVGNFSNNEIFNMK